MYIIQQFHNFGNLATLALCKACEKPSKSCPDPRHELTKGETHCYLSFDQPKESEPKEKPSSLLYRPIIKPQHLWLECYFFFVYSNKEKVTKKACPEQDRGEALHTFFLNDQKESVQRKSRRHRFIGQLLNHNIYGQIVTFSLSPATKKK